MNRGRRRLLDLAWANRSLRAKGVIVVALPLIALVVAAPLSYLTQRRVEISNDQVQHSILVERQVQDVLVSLLNAETGVRGYIATGEGEFLQPYLETQSALPASLERLASLVGESPTQMARLPQINALARQELDNLASLRQLRAQGAAADSTMDRLLLQGKVTMDGLRGVLGAMTQEETGVLASRQASEDHAAHAALAVLLIGTIVGLLGGTLAVLLFTRGVVRRVRLSQVNANFLAQGRPLRPAPPGNDEVSSLAGAIEDAGTLLAERQAALVTSEEKYRALAENFPNGAVATFDRDLRFSLAEGRLLGALGFSKVGLEGRTIWEAFDADRVTSLEPLYRAALAGESSSYERQIGDLVVVVQVVPIRAVGGEILGGMSVAIDITERKRAEEEVRETQAFLDSVIENIPNMVFVKSSSDLRFVRLNKAGEDLLGYSREDMIGKNDYDFFPQEEADFFSQKDREVLDGRKLLDIPDESIETTSGTRILHTKKIPILDAEGQPRYLLGISEDITERKRADDQLREAKEEAERANRAKDEFLSRMSHELRTPLNAVLGFAQVLEMGSLDVDQQDSIKQILRGGRHLLGLIDEVLDISRIASGQLTISQEPVLVADAIGEAVELARPIGAERGIEFRAESPNGFHVLADRQRLKQVLLNLLSNGVKYNRPGGLVSVSWEEAQGNRLRIKVSDTGPGISPQSMERLFNPFDRLGAEATGVQGTGLGLALTKRLMEAMGGSIEADSVVGTGSVFTVELGLAEPPVLGYEGKHETNVVSAPDERTRTILYIEDNPSNLELVERILATRPGLNLITAMQGSLGIELAREHKPEVILLDLHLPDMSGEEALRQLRKDPATHRTPIVVITADATSRNVKGLFAAGADDFLTKPLDVKRFIEILESLTGDEPDVV